MTDEDLARTLEAIDKVTTENSNSREQFMSLLVKVGIYDERGELAEPYRSHA